MWKEAGVPRENTRVQASDRHTGTVDHGVRTRIAAVKSECIVHNATWALQQFVSHNRKTYRWFNYNQSVQYKLSTAEPVLSKFTCTVPFTYSLLHTHFNYKTR